MKFFFATFSIFHTLGSRRQDMLQWSVTYLTIRLHMHRRIRRFSLCKAFAIHQVLCTEVCILDCEGLHRLHYSSLFCLHMTAYKKMNHADCKTQVSIDAFVCSWRMNVLIPGRKVHVTARAVFASSNTYTQCMFVCVCVCVCVCLFVCLFMCMYMRIFLFECVHVYVYMLVCVCAYGKYRAVSAILRHPTGSMRLLFAFTFFGFAVCVGFTYIHTYIHI